MLIGIPSDSLEAMVEITASSPGGENFLKICEGGSVDISRPLHVKRSFLPSLIKAQVAVLSYSRTVKYYRETAISSGICC